MLCWPCAYGLQMYKLVQFNDGVQIVPDKWIEKENDEILCAFPPKQQYCKLRSLLKNNSDAQSLWETYPCEILSASGK